MNKQLSPSPSDSGKQIAIYCAAEDLGEFITGLLGKPQVIRRALPGSFTICRDDLVGLHRLIEQRLHDQNEASLVQFLAAIRFDGGLMVEIASIDEFVHYAETRAVSTHSISLSWVYLIKFRGRSTPERQQIEVTFLVRNDADEIDYFIDSIPSMRGSRLVPWRSGVSVRINHTMRSWGMDLEALITDHLRMFVGDKRGRISKFLKTYSTPIGFVSFFATLSTLFALALKLVSIFGSITKPVTVPTNASLATLAKIESTKLDLIYSLLGGGHAAALTVQIILFILFSFVVSGAVGLLISVQCDPQYPSFILFTQSDEKNQIIELKRYSNHWHRTVAAALFSVICGLISNWLTFLL